MKANQASPIQMDWESVAKRIVEAVKRGDLSVRSIGLTNSEQLKLYRRMKKNNYPYSIFFFLLENIRLHFDAELEKVFSVILQHIQISRSEFVQREMERLPHVRQCVDLWSCLSKILES